MRSRAAPVVLVDARSSLRRAWARALLAADPSAKLSTCEAVAGVAALVPGGVPFVLVAPARELEAAPSALLERAAVIVTADPLEIPAAAEQFAGRAQALFERLDEPPVGLAIAVAAAARALAPPAPSNDEEAGFVAVSRPMRLLTAALEAIAPARTPLFLLGEDGTGKRTLARRAHVASGHASRPLVIVACSELGAEPHRALQIAIDEAGAGTLVLDRVDRSPSGATPALLELCDPPRLAARVIATGAASLREAARAGDMNSELFHRFAGRIFDVPPLRVRDACIPVLAAVFARGAAERMGLPVPRIAVEAVRALKSAPWPDNLPELRAAIEAAVAAAPIRAAGANDRRGSVLTLGDFGLVRPRRAGRIEGTLEPYAEARTRALAEFERNYVVDVLAHTGGNVSRAAHLAGMDRANFRRLAKRAMEKQRRSS